MVSDESMIGFESRDFTLNTIREPSKQPTAKRLVFCWEKSRDVIPALVM